MRIPPTGNPFQGPRGGFGGGFGGNGFGGGFGSGFGGLVWCALFSIIYIVNNEQGVFELQEIKQNNDITHLRTRSLFRLRIIDQSCLRSWTSRCQVQNMLSAMSQNYHHSQYSKSYHKWFWKTTFCQHGK